MMLSVWLLAALIVLVISIGFVGYIAFVLRLARKFYFTVSWPLGVGVMLSLIWFTGLAGEYNRVVQSAIIEVGVVLAIVFRHELGILRPRTSAENKRDLLWLIAPVLYFTTRFMTAGLPHEHVDALYYHLAAPKLWGELGQIRLTPEHPSYAYAALWDAIYGIPQLWLGGKSVKALITAQVVGQWLHVIWGQLASAILVATLIRHWVPKLQTRLGLSFFLGWIATTLPGVDWQGGLAKNDYLLIFFSLAALVELARRRYFLAGLMVGFAFSVKVLAVILIPGVFLVIAFDIREFKTRTWWLVAVGFLIGSLPILLRNWIWTKNPLFPGFDDVLGPGWVATGWLDYHKSFGGSPAYDPAMWEWVQTKFFYKALPKLALVLGAAALLFENFREWKQKGKFTQVKWISFLALELALVFLMIRPVADGRYGSFVEAFWVAFMLAAVVRVGFEIPKLRQYAWPAVLVFAFTVNIPLEQLIKVPRDYWFQPPTKYIETFHQHYPSKKWLNENTEPNELILFMADKFNFYLQRPFETAPEMKKWEETLKQYHSAQDWVRGLREQGYRFVHITPGGAVPGELDPYWNEILAMRTRAAYDSPTAVVFDLEKL